MSTKSKQSFKYTRVTLGRLKAEKEEQSQSKKRNSV
jgi:hypothetical protein